jgi:predicted metal-binding membrane protein
MPGGWTMSMVWMRMPDQTWASAGASFVGMWGVMMVAMMLPSLVPVLWRYRESVRRGGASGATQLGALTAVAGVAYFGAWTLLGAAVFPLGVALAAIEMRVPDVARLVPIAAGVVVVLAGVLQCSAWKRRHLACCREEHWRGGVVPATPRAAWRHGLRLAVHCIYCSAGSTAILLVVGIMDLRAMVVVALATIAERFAPNGERVARLLGLVAVCAWDWHRSSRPSPPPGRDHSWRGATYSRSRGRRAW